MYIAQYDAIILFNHWRVSSVFADGMAPIWHPGHLQPPWWRRLVGVTWSWWRHQMETFSALLAFCAGNSPAPGEFSAQRPVTRSFDVFFDLHPNKRLSIQWWGWWFETPPCPLWRHRNGWCGGYIEIYSQFLSGHGRQKPVYHTCIPHHCLMEPGTKYTRGTFLLTWFNFNPSMDM